MKHLKTLLIYIFIIGLLVNNSCAWASTINDSKSEIVLVACTPGDSLIKSQLSIPSEIIIDFIKWELTLYQTTDKQIFLINIQYGESQPNTLGLLKSIQTSITIYYSIRSEARSYRNSIV